MTQVLALLVGLIIVTAGSALIVMSVGNSLNRPGIHGGSIPCKEGWGHGKTEGVSG